MSKIQQELESLKIELANLESKLRQTNTKVREYAELLSEARNTNNRTDVEIECLMTWVENKKGALSKLEEERKEVQHLCLDSFRDFKSFQCQKTIDESKMEKSKDRLAEIRDTILEVDFATEEIEGGGISSYVPERHLR